MLYIVSTPIGNLKDITFRAIETLKSVDLIAAEDTRHTKILTSHYGITTPLTSYFEYNKFKKGDFLLELLKKGQKIALVSDSGTPGISDPGFHLIKLAIDNNIPITVIPGPTALIAALVLSGFPAHKFVFEGFLPAKKTARQKRLKELTQENRTIILYESPHRIISLLKDIVEIFGNRRIAVIREITKKFEQIKRAPATELFEYFTKNKPRGEFVVVI
ncbi:MAG: 16S rRNA (cytidine(1402)-2'-O)-methyltransferase [Candidatus Omnitrophota bacterium]|nr:16S rRNA (cytidine(1402)-2'-O)-methyltransferase [Candidatus Omnitrophota bacterium]